MSRKSLIIHHNILKCRLPSWERIHDGFFRNGIIITCIKKAMVFPSQTNKYILSHNQVYHNHAHALNKYHENIVFTWNHSSSHRASKCHELPNAPTESDGLKVLPIQVHNRALRIANAEHVHDRPTRRRASFP